MALMKLSGLITGIVGNVQGSTFQPYRGQTMMRTTGRPLRNQSLAVANQRARFGWAKSAWQALSPAFKAAWNNAALNFPFKSKTGEDYFASGYQLFLSTALVIRRYGGTISLNPPQVNQSGFGFSGEEVDIIGMQDKDLRVSWDDDPSVVDQLVDVSLSRPLPLGQTAIPRSFTSIGHPRYNAESLDITQDDLTALWGFVPTGPFRLVVRLRVVDIAHGFIGSPTFIPLVADLDDDPEV